MTTSNIFAARHRNQMLINVFAWVVMLALALPGFWIIMTAFRSNGEINASPPVWIPRELTLEAFANMFGLNPDLQQRVPVENYMANSMVAALISTGLSLVAGTLAAYAFSRFRFRLHTLTFLAIMLSRTVPGVALSLPLFILFNQLKILNSVYSVAFVYVAINIPFTVWLMDGFFRQIPRDLTEAAYIDGCGYWSAFWRVDLPLALPGLAAAGIFAFLENRSFR